MVPTVQLKQFIRNQCQSTFPCQFFTSTFGSNLTDHMFNLPSFANDVRGNGAGPAERKRLCACHKAIQSKCTRNMINQKQNAPLQHVSGLLSKCSCCGDVVHNRSNCPTLLSFGRDYTLNHDNKIHIITPLINSMPASFILL